MSGQRLLLTCLLFFKVKIALLEFSEKRKIINEKQGRFWTKSLKISGKSFLTFRPYYFFLEKNSVANKRNLPPNE